MLLGQKRIKKKKLRLNFLPLWPKQWLGILTKLNFRGKNSLFPYFSVCGLRSHHLPKYLLNLYKWQTSTLLLTVEYSCFNLPGSFIISCPNSHVNKFHGIPSSSYCLNMKNVAEANYEDCFESCNPIWDEKIIKW